MNAFQLNNCGVDISYTRFSHGTFEKMKSTIKRRGSLLSLDDFSRPISRVKTIPLFIVISVNMPALIQAESPKAVCTHRTHKSTNSKRVIVCCDGTWNDSNSGGSPASNVSRLSGAIAHKCCSGMPQLVFYRTGAGTEASFVAKQLGGIFGQGVVLDIVRCYRFICDNYNPGDEVILIGFSRGAFTARSVAALVCALGFLNRAGVDHLKDIFDDYCAWSKWDKYTAFDEKKHLAGFTLENKMRINKIRKVMQQPGAVLRTEDELAKELLAERKELFSKIVAANHDSEAIAKMYREMLVKVSLLRIDIPSIYGILIVYLPLA